MKQPFTLFLSAILATVFMVPTMLYGSHAMGADMTYKCLGNNQYEITLQFYRDCDGVSAPTSANVTATSSCGGNVSVILTRDPQYSFLEVTPLCPPLRQCSRCNSPLPAACQGVSYPGVEVYTYRGIITLPFPCADWRIAYNLCCRNAAVTNLQGPGGATMYLDLLINNTDTLCTNSPVFSQLPTPYICNNQPYNYNHGVIYQTTNNNDSIVYELVQPRQTGSTPINYVAPYSVINPMSTLTGMTFNQSNGQLYMVPNQVQHAVMVVRVSVYRNGVLISQSHRDIQVVVIDCPTNQILPVVGNYINPGGGGYYIDSINLGICPNNTLTFDLIGTDGNATDSVFITSNFTQVFAGGTMTVSGNNPTTASFTWRPTPADVGVHYFQVTVTDNNCPVIGSQTFTYAITVLDQIDAGPDQKFCFIGGPIRLEAKGGSAFSWRPTNSIVDAAPDSSWIMVFPSQTTTYIVTSDCNDDDSVTVELVPSFNYSIAPNDTICRFEESVLWVNTDSAFAPFTYNWAPNYRLDTNGISIVTSMPFNTTTYTVEMISKDGCKVVDSIEVYIKGESPRITLTPDKLSLCPDPDDEVNIDFLSIPSLCGPSATGCLGSNTTVVNVGTNDNTLSSIPTPYQGYYRFSRMQMLYTRQELNAMDIYGGTISSIGFNIGIKQSNRAYQSFTISILCTEVEALENEFIEGLDAVYGPTTVNTTNGWNNYNLTTPFDWDGFTNLIVEVCFTNTSPGGPLSDQVYFTPTSRQTVLFRMSDIVSPGCELLIPISSNKRPNTRFEICGQPITNYDITWTPATGLSDPKSPTPVISGLTQTTTYNVLVDNNGCIANYPLTIYVDSTVLTVTGDTLLCDTIPFELRAEAIGLNPSRVLNCGTNNTPIVGTTQTISAANSNSKSWLGTMFQGNVTDMRYQILLRANDLRSMGMRSGVITSLSMQLAGKASIAPVQNFKISMGCTTDDQIATTGFVATPHTVYTSPIYNTQTGWNVWSLANTFDWDGTSNLVIDFCWDNPDNTFIAGSDNLIVYDISYNGSGRAYSVNGLPGCDLANPTNLYRVLPNLQFEIAEPPPGDFEYSWTCPFSSYFLTNPDSANTVVFTQEPGCTYHVSTTTKFGCVLRDSVKIEVKILDVRISEDTAICFGESAALGVSGSGDQYQWSPATPDMINPNGQAVLVTPPATTTYNVVITDTASGCNVARDVTVTVHPLPIVDAGDTVTILIGQSTLLNGFGGPNWFWEPTGSLDDPNSGNPNAKPFITTTYTLTVVDANGCTMWDTVTVFVESIDDVFIPNAFSPNGDGVNDMFYIVPFGLTELEDFLIVNRWGEVVFQTNDFSKGWDGRVNGEPQSIGTYVYYIRGFDYKGDQVTRQGNITLVR